MHVYQVNELRVIFRMSLEIRIICLINVTNFRLMF